MKRLLVLFISILLIMSMLLSCIPAQNTITTTQSITISPTSTTQIMPTLPEGELIASINNFGSENFIPWLDSNFATLHNLVYDNLIYYNTETKAFIPGLAESWETSADALTLTYHLRKGIFFQDGWGEFTASDLKYNFEMQASPTSVGKTTQCRNIASMEIIDNYTLFITFKTPAPTFWLDFSTGGSAPGLGIVSSKYLMSVGEEIAAKKPIGTGPWSLVSSQFGYEYKFIATNTHWRVVPEFKYLTVRLLSETSTIVAALQNKEIDLAIVPPEQVPTLNSAGIATEQTSFGWSMSVVFGGMTIPEDKRFNINASKDPWSDIRVRKAMNLAINREAIVNAIYFGQAKPINVPLYSDNMNSFPYPYDPIEAKRLLTEAGYPNGFNFIAISYLISGNQEGLRLMEALCGYWSAIGLKPTIEIKDYTVYTKDFFKTGSTSGQVFIRPFSYTADHLAVVTSFFLPNSNQVAYVDKNSYILYNNSPKLLFSDRKALADALNQYYFDNSCLIPIVKVGNCYAWNPKKLQAWPHSEQSRPNYYEYIRHSIPLNTYRLFSISENR